MFDKELKEHENYLWDELRYVFLNNSLIGVLEGALFEKIDKETIKHLETVGEERFNNNIPPGYKDRDKQENKFGTSDENSYSQIGATHIDDSFFQLNIQN